MIQSSDPHKREAFTLLFPCLRKMVDACPDTNPVRPLFYAKGLPIKIFRQTCSVCAILGRVPVPHYEPETIGDPDSIQVLTRSILESYLIFHHLFIAPQSEAEREFWWFTWALKSIVSRSEMMNSRSAVLPTVQYDEKAGKRIVKTGSEVRDNMRKNAEEIREILRANAYYKHHVLLPDKKLQKRFRKWAEDGWKSSPTQQLRDANMKHFTTWDIYGFLSSSAHTDHISVKQTLLTRTRDEQIAFAEASLHVILIVVGRLCLELPIVFPEVRPIITENAEALRYALTYKSISELEELSPSTKNHQTPLA